MTTKTTKFKSSQYDWPTNVWDINVEDLMLLSEAELVLFLTLLGQRPEDQPKFDSKQELADHIFATIGEDSIRGQAVYEVICHNTLPQGTKPMPKGIFTDTVFWEAARGLVKNIVQTDVVSKSLDEKVLRQTAIEAGERAMTNALDAAIDMLRDEVESRLDAAAKKVQRIEVVGFDKKPHPLPKVRHAKFDRIMRLAGQRLNIALVGPSGCGKTHIAEQVAQALGARTFAAQSLSAGVTESSFTGWLLPMGKGGEYVHVPTPFLDCYEKGGVFLFDEADNADANMLVFLNMALANKQFFLPTRKGDTTVTKHKDFVAMAAMNTYGHGADAIFVGRAALDGATKDRFRMGMVEMDYDRDMERALGISEPLLEWGWKVRETITRAKLQRIMSTRSLIDAQKLMNAGDTLQEATAGYWVDWTADERRLIPA